MELVGNVKGDALYYVFGPSVHGNGACGHILETKVLFFSWFQHTNGTNVVHTWEGGNGVRRLFCSAFKTNVKYLLMYNRHVFLKIMCLWLFSF